jgi:hypothetical protein
MTSPAFSGVAICVTAATLLFDMKRLCARRSQGDEPWLRHTDGRVNALFFNGAIFRIVLPWPGALEDHSMNRLGPEMAAGLCIRTERHGEVRELDVAPSQNAKRQLRRISKRRDAAVARDECGAGDHKPAADSRAELGAAHHPIGADHAVRHEDVVRVGPPSGGIVLVYRALRNAEIRGLHIHRGFKPGRAAALVHFQ